MCTDLTDAIPPRLLFARSLIKWWPLRRGHLRLARLLLYKFEQWPIRASFRFRFGCFVNTPIAPWPKGYRELFLYGIIDHNEVAIWHRVLKAGENVVDGGANWGYWSLVASTIVGNSGRVYAFEPVPDTCASLRENLRASQNNNVIVYQEALAERGGSTYINVAEDDPIETQSSIGFIDGLQVKERIECRRISLDEVFQGRPVRLIKLDIEGGELEALNGSRRILQRKKKPVITFEWNRLTAAALGYQPEAIQEFLYGFGYRLFLAASSGLIPFIERTNYVQWSPMVWALTDIHQNEVGL